MHGFQNCGSLNFVGGLISVLIGVNTHECTGFGKG